MYRGEGKLQEAIELQERAVSMRRTGLGEEHPSTLNTPIELGITYRSQGRVAVALELQEKMLVEARRLLGDEHHLVLHLRKELDITYFCRGHVLCTRSGKVVREYC